VSSRLRELSAENRRLREVNRKVMERLEAAERINAALMSRNQQLETTVTRVRDAAIFENDSA
jgi:hypothetical protein